MAVETKKVQGRRTVRYESYADLLADAETMVASEVKLLGNWSLGQILKHLAISHHTSIDGIDMKVAWPIKLLVKTFMKKRFLNKPMPTGFKIPAKLEGKFIPDESADAREALEELRAAVERVQSAPKFALHAMLGKLTAEEWEKFNLRHSEAHMSFVVPQ